MPQPRLIRLDRSKKEEKEIERGKKGFGNVTALLPRTGEKKNPARLFMYYIAKSWKKTYRPESTRMEKWKTKQTNLSLEPEETLSICMFILI